MPHKTQHARILLEYCRERLEQINQEVALLRDIVEMLEARAGCGEHDAPSGQQRDKEDGA